MAAQLLNLGRALGLGQTSWTKATTIKVRSLKKGLEDSTGGPFFVH